MAQLNMPQTPVHIVGGGLAGTEAAWQLTQSGIPVVLHEMRPVRGTDAHVTDSLAELVCSNSFRSDDAEQNAVGLLHAEMRRANSIILAAADRNQAVIDTGRSRLIELFSILDRYLGETEYVGGDDFTMGDIPIGISTWRWFAMPLDRPDLLNVARWFEALKARPAYQAHIMKDLA